eukprot:GHVL01018201.1.p1 GENE.GHVL01018201.1~~GHVL01018201.1.p1  ORF type:complete len:130 (+),score=14.23 GHVL01018201.1:311-700(+)
MHLLKKFSIMASKGFMVNLLDPKSGESVPAFLLLNSGFSEIALKDSKNVEMDAALCNAIPVNRIPIGPQSHRVYKGLSTISESSKVIDRETDCIVVQKLPNNENLLFWFKNDSRLQELFYRAMRIMHAE